MCPKKIANLQLFPLIVALVLHEVLVPSNRRSVRRPGGVLDVISDMESKQLVEGWDSEFGGVTGEVFPPTESSNTSPPPNH